MGVLVLCAAGGIALHFLVELGATKFEIDEIYTGLGAAIAYPIFSLGLLLAFYLVRMTNGLIKAFPSNKKMETIHFYVAVGSGLIGAAMLIISANQDNRLLVGSFAWMIFYLPGLTFRFIMYAKECLKETKKIIVVSVCYLGFVLIPAIFQAFQFANEAYGYGIFGLVYIIPLFGLLTIYHEEDGIEEEAINA